MCYVAAESVNTTIAVTIRFRFIIFSQIHISVTLDMHIFCIFQVIAYSCSHFLYIIIAIARAGLLINVPKMKFCKI